MCDVPTIYWNGWMLHCFLTSGLDCERGIPHPDYNAMKGGGDLGSHTRT